MFVKPFTRQFAITKQAAWLDGWASVPSLNRYIHSCDLEVTQSQDLRVSLLGYAIDPKNTESSNREIVNQLASGTSDEAIQIGSSLAGRWVLLCEFQDRQFVMHDPCGLRQVFYSSDFCASQASTAAKFFPLLPSEDALNGFLSTQFAKTNEEYWWPGDSTQYKGVKCLLPNHYLDLNTLTTHRYGIDALETVATGKECAEILTANIRAAAQRFDLALPLTAGWDSRTILASCLNANIKPHCYTLKWGDRTNSHQDLRIPPQLINWQHQVIECPTQATRESYEFSKAFHESVNPAHDSSIPMGLWYGYPKGKVSLSGHCSEVARCFYKERDALVDARYLAHITGMDATPFILEQFESWLADALPESKRCGIHILDLFYWEQRAGRWAANGQAQWDIVHERFTPFNHRPLIFSLLSAPESLRKYPDYLLYREMIENMAPHLLQIPVNPDSAKRQSIFRKTVAGMKSLISA